MSRLCSFVLSIFFCKQKTSYELRISDWSSDVCSSDLFGKLWISSGERQQMTPAQDMQSNLGKIVRLNADGSVPADNPFASQGGVAATVWTLGHRHVLGLAFAVAGRLWEHELGPKIGRRSGRERVVQCVKI